MNHRTLSFFVACVVISSLLLSACQPGSVPVVSAAKQTYNGLRVSAPNCKYGGNIKMIEAVDQYTVRFTLCSTDPAFAAKVAFPVFAIQDQDLLVTSQGNSMRLDLVNNGTGSYIVKEWVHGDHITLEANPDYWGVPPKTKVLEFRWNPSATSRQAAMQVASLDAMDRPAQGDLAMLKEDPKLLVFSRPSLNTLYLGMNNTFSPFNNEKVRQAFSMALDRQSLLETLFMQGSEVAEQFLPSTMDPGYTPGYRWYDFNQKEAGDLLDDANFDKNQVIPLSYSTAEKDYLANPEIAAQAIRDQLGQIGIQVVLDPHPDDDFNAGLQNGQYALFLTGWAADFPDATDFYNTHFAGTSKEFGNPYSDIVFMLKQAGREFDIRQRQSRYNRINELIHLHAPAIPIAHGNTALVFNGRVQNITIGPMNENFEEMTTPNDYLVFIQSNEPRHLWPADETDSDSLRVSRLVYDTLLTYDFGGTSIKPGLAEYWESNSNMTEWTFLLRYGVKFSNGKDLDANDVVASFAAQWDAKNPSHTGETGEFRYFQRFFGGFINQ